MSARRLSHRPLSSIFPRRRRLTAAVTATVVLVAMVAQADLPRPVLAATTCESIGYAYDAAGRLVGARDQTNQTVRYGYDATGNRTQVQNAGSPDLAVLSVSPVRGAPGTDVTISGGCYSPVVADNSVSFNGVPATVTSASPHRLVATVPAAASTGPVSVTVGGVTAASTDAFVVAGSAAAPVVTGVSPRIVAPGDPVNVTGTGFDPIKLNDLVTLNASRMLVQTVGAGAITAQVATGAGSGRVGVRTMFGRGDSADDVYVAPAPYTVADIGFTGRAARDVATPVSLPTAGKVGLLIFDLGQGDRVSVRLAGSTFGTCGLSSVKVLDPFGRAVRTLGCPSGSDFIDTFAAPSTGTYTLLFVASSTATGSVTATVNTIPADATAALTVDGPQISLSNTVPGQNAVATFTGTAGQRVSVKFGGGSSMGFPSVTFRNPDGTQLLRVTSVISDFVEPLTLPADGTYSLLVDPGGASVGTLTIQAWTVPADAAAVFTVDGPQISLSNTVPGQNATASFTGTAGQRVSVKFGGGSSMGFPSVTFRNPDGTQLLRVTSVISDFVEPLTLPADGTYTLFVDPGGASVGTLTIQAWTVPADATAALTVGGPQISVSNTTPGQNAVVSFAGTAGQRVSVKFGGGSSMGFPSVTFRNPDGSQLLRVTSVISDFVEPVTLPADGTYTLFVDPGGASVGTLTIRAWSVPADVTATATVGGADVPVTISTPGQNAVLSFTGAADQNLGFTFSSATFGASTTYTVRKPDGSTLVSGNSSGASTFLGPIMLPVGGAYTILVNPSDTAVGSVSTGIDLVVNDATAEATVGGPGVTVTTTVSGQNAAVTFAGTAGQRVSVTFPGATISATVSVRNPDGSNLRSPAGSTSSSSFFEPMTLPATGTYTVFIDPQGGTVGTFGVQLFDVPADATASFTVDGPQVSVSNTVPGQNAVFSFAGTAGARVSFNFVRTNMGSFPTVTIRNPDGSTLRSVGSVTGTSFVDPIALAVTGTYTVFVDAAGSGTGSMAVQAWSVPADATATFAVDGPQVSVSNTVPGQNAVFSFAGTAGTRVSFNFVRTNMGSFPTVTILNPDGSTLRSVGSVTGTSFVDPIALAVTGTYTVFVDAAGSGTGSMAVQAWSVPADATATFAVDGPQVSVSNTVPGQNAVFSFAGTAGTRVSFNFVRTNMGSFPTVTILNPDGSTLRSVGSVTGTSFVDPIALAVTGTYTVFVDAAGSGTGSMAVQAWSVPADATATFAVDGPQVSVSNTVPGQNAVFSFAGTAGTRVSFNFVRTNMGSFPTVTILNPDGSTLRSVGSVTGTSFVDPIALAVTGTYTVFVDAAGSGTGSMAVQAWSVPADATATFAVDGPQVSVSNTVPGQNAVFSFAGTAGTRVSFNFVRTNMGSFPTVTIRNPDGSTLRSVGSVTGTSFVEPLTLTATGTHTVFVDPATSGTGSMAVQAWTVPADATATATVNGPGQTVTTTAPGQNASVTFSGAAGQVVTVAGSGNTFGFTAFALRRPDNTNLNSTSTSSASFSFSNVTLPVAGTYTVSADPSGTAIGHVTITVTSSSGLAAAGQPAKPAPVAALDKDDSELWTPDRSNLGGADWESHRAAADTTTNPLWQAPAGITAVSGRVLRLNGQPLAGVTLSIADRSARTDASGRFLLANVHSGHGELVIDGTTANGPGREYGRFEVGLTVPKGRTLLLPYTIWMTRLDTRNAVSFPSPTTRETVLTTPKIPGFEVRLPEGSVVRDSAGQVVTRLSITAIPVDRPPFPLPAGVVTPVYFTVQPGGAYVFPAGARIVYPNTTGMAPRTRVDFWDYDAGEKGWYVYGQGRVTADGRQVVPDPGVRVWEFSGAMINVGGQNPADEGPNDNEDGDPVDLSSGLFVDRHTDLVLPDVMPISITRSYRQRDSAMRAFGVGTNFEYGAFLHSQHQYSEADLVFPDSFTVHFVRTSPGTGFSDAVFAAVGTPGPFAGSTMAWNGDGWDLVRTDGTVYVFGENQPMQAIRDRHGNQITLTRSSGGQSGNITQITSPGGRWIKLSYDSGNRITQAQDDTGRVVGYQYDTGGRLVQVTSPSGAVTRYAYNSSNAMTTITDARGIAYLTNTYDSNGFVSAQQFAGGATYQFSYVRGADGYSTETTVTDPEGGQRRVRFDSAHYTIENTLALGTPLERTWTAQRDPVSHQLTGVSDPQGRITSMGFGANGRVASLVDYAGTAQARTTTVTNDGPFGQYTALTDPAGGTTRIGYNPSGDATSLTDAENRQTQFAYDPSGRATTITGPAGDVTSYRYDHGDLVSIVDPLGRTTRRFVDALGRPTALIDPTGAASVTEYDADNKVTAITDGLGDRTGFGYDANGNLTSVTDARGHTSTYAYDAQDRLTDRTDPLGKVTHYTYDRLGRVVTATDRRGTVTTYHYDALGRPTLIEYGTESTVTLSYDARDRLAQAVDSTSGTVTFGYDALDQVTSVTGPAGRIDYSYDTLGRRTGMSVPGQPAIAYSYDATGLISSITQGGVAVQWQRDGAGRTSSVTQPGLTTAYSYDAASQLTGITFTGSGGTPIGDLRYGHDANGRVADLSGTLAHVTIPSTGPPASYDAADRLVGLGGQAFSYDDEGNLTGDGTRGYTWNARNQLSTVSGGGVTASFSYDAFGRRASSTVNGATTTFLYDGPQLVKELGATSADRLTGESDQTFRRTGSGGARIPLTDYLGSTIGLVDPASGALVTQYSYDPFGNPTASGGSSDNPQQYTGREYDSQTGLLYNRSRYYHPGLGRFLSQDPAGLGGGSTNPYVYALDDPVNLSDPNGDCPVCAAMLGGCVIGGVIGVATGWGLSKLFGRKYSWGDGFRDFGVGCVTGALTEGLGSLLSRGAAAGEELTGTALARQLGREGEQVLNGAKNTERIASATKTAAYRTPDYLNHAAKEIGEVKNVAYQALTNQLRDDVAYAQANGYKFYLWVRSTTQLSGPLQDLVNKGQVILRYLP